jgi:hypothetical protein
MCVMSRAGVSLALLSVCAVAGIACSGHVDSGDVGDPGVPFVPLPLPDARVPVTFPSWLLDAGRPDDAARTAFPDARHPVDARASVDSSTVANDAQSPQQDTPDAPTHLVDASPPFDARPHEAAVDVGTGDPCAPGGAGRLLACSNDCPDSLYASVALEDDFGSGSQYSELWAGSYAAPTLTSSGLQFGPHPASPDWWNTYSPTTTDESDFGDVMFCVRFTFDTTPSAVAIPDGGTYADAFQVSIRGGSEGMVLGVGGVSESVSLTTKIDSTNSWVTHASAAFDLAPGMHTMELALYGEGNSFYSEVKEVGTGVVVPLQATYALPATGPVQMLGWQLPQPLTVTRVAIGTPSSATAARIAR